jgi:hypothetical protein
MPWWLQFAAVLALSLVAWISGMDTHGSPHVTSALWLATVLAGGHLAYRAIARSR